MRKHIKKNVDGLNKGGAGFRVLAGAGAQIDTTTANGRLIFGIFAALAEFEAELSENVLGLVWPQQGHVEGCNL